MYIFYICVIFYLLYLYFWSNPGIFFGILAPGDEIFPNHLTFSLFFINVWSDINHFHLQQYLNRFKKKVLALLQAKFQKIYYYLWKGKNLLVQLVKLLKTPHFTALSVLIAYCIYFFASYIAYIMTAVGLFHIYNICYISVIIVPLGFIYYTFYNIWYISCFATSCNYLLTKPVLVNNFIFLYYYLFCYLNSIWIRLFYFNRYTSINHSIISKSQNIIKFYEWFLVYKIKL